MEKPNEHHRGNRSNNNSSHDDYIETSTSSGGGRNKSFREELLRLMYGPPQNIQQQSAEDTPLSIEPSLSAIPWKITILPTTQVTDATPNATSNNNQHCDLIVAPTATSEAQHPLQPLLPNSLCFPSVSYLDLRRTQNILFADSKSNEAESILMKSSRSSNRPMTTSETPHHHQQQRKDEAAARNAWVQALELVPDHLPSLVGYGKFRADKSAGGDDKEAESLLRRALDIDPTHANAKKYLTELLENRKRKEERRMLENYNHPRLSNSTNLSNRNKNLTARESSAYQDALMERQLLVSPKPGKEKDEDANENDDFDYQDDDTERSERSRRDHRSRRRSRHERRKAHKKRSRHKKRRRKEHRDHDDRKRRHKYSSHDYNYDSNNEGDEHNYASSSSLVEDSPQRRSSYNGDDSDNSPRSSQPSIGEATMHRKRKRGKRRHVDEDDRLRRRRHDSRNRNSRKTKESSPSSSTLSSSSRPKRHRRHRHHRNQRRRKPGKGGDDDASPKR